MGVGYNYKGLPHSTVDLKDVVKRVWTETKYPSWSGGGTDAKRRIPKLVPLGREMFKV